MSLSLFNIFKYLTIKFLYFSSYIIFRMSHGLASERSRRQKLETFGIHNENSRKYLHSTAKKGRLGLENSNSKKRRVNEQARLMKIKNFPPDFFNNADLPSATEHKHTFSVDRVQSRRQRRAKNSKDSIVSLQRNSNKKTRRNLSEQRKPKRIVSRDLNSMQVPRFFQKENKYNNNYINYKSKQTKVPNNSVSQLKGASFKSVRSEASLLQNGRLPSEDNGSSYSVVTSSVLKETIDRHQATYDCDSGLSRKFSHINQLAQRLALHDEEDIPFNMAKKLEGPQTSTSKLEAIKIKRRLNINKSNVLLKDGNSQLHVSKYAFNLII